MNLVAGCLYKAKFSQRIVGLLFLFFLQTPGTFAQMRQINFDPDIDNKVEKISLYSLSEGYIAYHNWLGYTQDSGRTYLKKYVTNFNVDISSHPTANIIVGFSFAGVKAFNKDTLIAYGNYASVPAILYSTDQGNNFKLVYYGRLKTTYNVGIADMVFPQNTNVGYAIDAENILKTTDRGKTWKTCFLSFDYYLDRIEAPDDNTIITFNVQETKIPARLLRSDNGGITWQHLTLPSTLPISHATFLTPLKGWLNLAFGPQTGTIYFTSDGGTTWTNKNNPVIAPYHFDQMKFVNDSLGFAVSDSFTVYKTTDSGKIWQPLRRDKKFEYFNYGHRQLFVSGDKYLWAGGHHGLLEISTNGGGIPLPKSYFRIDTAGLVNGGNVRLKNFSPPGYQFKWFVNGKPAGTGFDAIYTHDFSRSSDSVMLVATDGQASDTARKIHYFPSMPIPAVSSIFPLAGTRGTEVTLKGKNLKKVIAVTFGGVPATSFLVLSDTTVLAVVGNGSSGNVGIAVSYTSNSGPAFTVLPDPVDPAPVVTGIIPASAPAGSIVTIAGRNFNPALPGNIVYFGKVQAKVLTASSTRLECIVPAGAIFSVVSVINTSNSLTGYSQHPFSIPFADSSNFTSNSFRRALTINEGVEYLYKVSSGDFDGDGKVDLVGSVGYAFESYVVLKNTSTPDEVSFAPAYKIGQGNYTWESSIPFVHDIDGDGKLDIAATTNTHIIWIARNTSNGGGISFAPKIDITVGRVSPTSSHKIAFDDLDGDGRADLAVSINSSTQISILKNTSRPGMIAFAPVNQLKSADLSAGYNVAIADIDGDGKKDVISLNSKYTSNASSFTTFRNTGTTGKINFAAGIEIPIQGHGLQSQELFIADYDMDGRPDVTIVHDETIHLFLNNSTVGNVAFALPVSHNRNSGFFDEAAMANFCGGVRPDLAVGGDREIWLSRNLSVPGKVRGDSLIPVETWYYYSMHSADINNDGKPDLVYNQNSGFNTVLTILLNKQGVAVPKRICTGGDGTIKADVPGTNYKWQIDSGVGFADLIENSVVTGSRTSTLAFTKTPVSWNNYSFRCLVDTLKSSVFQLDVSGKRKPEATISTDSVYFCKGAPVTFNVKVLNGGDPPGITWQVNGQEVQYGGFKFTTTSLSDSDQVRAVVSSSDICSYTERDTSSIVMFEKGITPSVTITGPLHVCSGIDTIFIANPFNGGPAPSYQWEVSGQRVGGDSSVLHTSLATQGKFVRVVMTSNSTSCNVVGPVASNSIYPSVHDNVNSAITIVGGASRDIYGVCEGSTAEFSASWNTSGGNSIQWQVNGINVGRNAWWYDTDSISDGSKVQAILTTTSYCSTPKTVKSNIVTVKKYPRIIPSVSISGDTILKAGQSVVITAVPGIPDSVINYYEWQDSSSIAGWRNLSGNTNKLTYTPAVSGVKLRGRIYTSWACSYPFLATSNVLRFTVNTVTGIDPVPTPSLGINFYPNPVTSYLTINRLKLTDKWETLEIAGIDGEKKLVLSITGLQQLRVNTSNMAAGLYVAVLRRKSGTPAYIKFIKQ